MEDRAVALKLAQDADPGPPAASWRMVKFTLMVLVVCMCSGDSGFDGTVMSSVNSMPRYLEFFGLPAGGNSKTGIVFGAYTVGQVLAFLVVSWLPDKLGRRYGMFIGNCVLM
jgi:MFS family permease